jgi:nitrogenase molybdenum-iron protein beta chain
MSDIIEQPRYVCTLAAQQTVLGIKRAIPIVHAGPGCSAKLSQALNVNSGFQSHGYISGAEVPSTNSSESEVVFGGEKKLKSTIDGTLKVLDGDLYVVLTGCTADIVGDDVEQVVSKYREEGIPIVSVQTGGFIGNNYKGHELVLQAIINQYIGDVKPNTTKGLVNIFSVVPYQDTFWRADLEEIKVLLEKIGLKVNILFGYEANGVEEWRNIPNAQFNLVLSPWVGLDTAKLLQTKYGTPYLHYPVLPIGAIETNKFLKTVGKFADIDEEKINEVIEKEEYKFYEYIKSMAEFLTENRFNLPDDFYTIADSTYALAISNFLINEFSFIPKTQFIIDDPDSKYIGTINESFNNILEDTEGQVIIENDGGKIHEIIKSHKQKAKKTIIFGSSWEKELTKNINGYLLNVSLPVSYRIVVNKTYVGYKGGLNLIEDIYSKVLEESE